MMISKLLFLSLITSLVAVPSSNSTSAEVEHIEGAGYLSINDNIYIFDGPNHCRVVNGILYINDESMGPLTAEQQEQLQQYTTQVRQWSADFGKSILHDFWSGFKGLFGNSEASTTMQPAMSTSPFPQAPAFCNQS